MGDLNNTMLSLAIKDILDATGGQCVGDIDVSAALPRLSTDSRTSLPGDCFVAISGDNFDGHAFVGPVLAAGAAGALVSKNFDLDLELKGKWLIKVDDVLDAFRKIATLLRLASSAKTVAITGSNGKTTTKDICASIFQQVGRTMKTQGNLNNTIGVPITMTQIEKEDKYAVIEMGMSSPGEIEVLTKICQPHIGVITNISSAHMEFFTSLEGIAAAKSELLEAAPTGSIAVLNRDDPFFDFFKAKAKGRVISFGTCDGCDIRGKNIVWNRDDGISFELVISEERRQCFLPIPGFHNLCNALAAAGAAHAAGVSIDSIASGFKSVVTSPMRSRVIDCSGYKIYLDAYNANPSSTSAAIDYIAGIGSAGRCVYVLGDMLELGEAALKEHRKIVEKILHSSSGVLITYGPIYKKIYKSLKCCYSGHVHYVHYDSHEEIVSFLKKSLRDGDWVLLKGSRGLKMEDLAVWLGVDPQLCKLH